MKNIDLSQVALENRKVSGLEVADLGQEQTTSIAAGLQLPPHDGVSYFAAYQKYDPMQDCRDQAIGGGFNRVQGLLLSEWNEGIEGGLFAIIQLDNGMFMSLLPLAGRKSLAWIKPEDNKPTIQASTLGTASLPAQTPLLAWAVAPTALEASDAVWQETIKHPLFKGMARHRNDKTYPHIFTHLGWCSWEHYRKDIKADELAEDIDAMNQSDIPIRYVLIDDGYYKKFPSNEDMLLDRLLNFEPHSSSFPQGFAPLIEKRDTTSSNNISWFGLWQNFNGYWGFVDKDHTLGAEMNSHLMTVESTGKLPKQSMTAASFFYEKMIRTAREAGFDFVKVDDQAQNLLGYIDGDVEKRTPNPIEAATNCSQALEREVSCQLAGQINCMAHGPITTANTSLSVVTRCSEDYELNSPWRAKAHLHNSYNNMLWLGPTIWGDHDMFHSSDEFAAEMMALSKAISGGPICISDAPKDMVPERISPLCYSDGKLLRPIAPAMPLEKSVMTNPFEEKDAYFAQAPLENGALAIVAYNLTEPTQKVTGILSPDDYCHPHHSERPEKLLLYNWFTKECQEFTDAIEFEIDTFDHRYWLIIPIEKEWAVIGDTTRFLSPAAVKATPISNETILITSREEAVITLWHKQEIRTVSLTKGENVIT